MNRRSRNRPRNDTAASDPVAFWRGGRGGRGASGSGSAAQASPPSPSVRPASDPAAVLRSLGTPPLGRGEAATHHLAVVYEEAVRAASALAAANGLLADTDTSIADLD